MNKNRFLTKVLCVFMLAILLTGAISVTSLAADREASYDNKYGQIIPTDAKLEAPRTSYSFNGDSAILYFMCISTGSADSHFAIEIYADKNYQSQIKWLENSYGEEGSRDYRIKWDFKNTPSGTYYGKCYTYITKSNGDNVIDSDSVRTFKIKIDRLSKKTVKLTSISNVQSGVKITWNPVPTATTYKVYRKASGDKTWTNIVNLAKGASTYTDKTAKSGKKYTYTVKAFDGNYKTLPNPKGISITALSAPKLKSVAASTSKGYAKFTWEKVPGATGYYVYRKGGALNNSKWEKIATIKSGSTVSYVDKKATSTNWYYTYTVKAFNKTTTSAYNKTGLNFNYLKAPTLKSTSITAKGIKITWSYSDTDATHYWVYRKSGDSWVKLGKATGKSYTDTTAVSGKTYTYTVKPACKTNVGAYNTTGISSKFLSVPVLKDVTFDSSNRAKVTWNKVSGAAGYRVYRKTTTEKSWKKIADITNSKTTSYLDTVKKVSGEKYIYTVKAVNGKYASPYNSTGVSKVFLSAPSFTLKNAAKDTSNIGINVSWKAIKGATSYTVYRKAADDTAYKTIAKNVTATSYYDSAVASGVTYQYRVKALCTNGASNVSTKSITAIEAPELIDAVLTDEGVTVTWNTVNGAESYYVYRKTETGKWEVIGSYALNTYTDVSDEAKTGRFYYTVAAESKGYTSAYNTTGIKAFASLTEFTAQLIEEENASPRITLDWSFDDVTESVEIFKSLNGESYISQGVFTKESGILQYEDYNVEIGNTYTYVAKAVKDGKVSTEETATVEYPYPPLEAVEVNAEGFYSEEDFYITVTWSLNELAESYEVYRRSAPDAQWEAVATFTAEEIAAAEGAVYVDHDIDTETDYYYTVKAVRSDRESLYDENGKHVKILLPVEPVTGIIAVHNTRIEILEDGTEKETNSAVITWDASLYAEVYCVLRKTADTEWAELGRINAGEELTYTDETIEQGTEYTYTIKAIAEGRTEAVNQLGVSFCWALPEAPEGDDITPPEGEGTTPPEGEGTTPPEGEGTTPPEGEVTTPPEGEGTITPEEGETTL